MSPTGTEDDNYAVMRELIEYQRCEIERRHAEISNLNLRHMEMTTEIERLRAATHGDILEMLDEIERLTEALYEIGNHSADHDRAIESLMTIEEIARKATGEQARKG